MKLFTQLDEFNYSHIYNDPEKAKLELQPRFLEVARTMFYGGYIDVWGTYRIYLRGVEFYFHEEYGKIDDKIEDPIVYHRNGGSSFSDLKEVPEFPTMSLHAHASGFDITFEKNNIRASALIRKYAVYDVKAKKFLDRGKGWEDSRSTYLYDFLNGFSLSRKNDIVWVDKEIGRQKAISEPQSRVRTKAKTGDDRKWRFVALEDIRDQI